MASSSDFAQHAQSESSISFSSTQMTGSTSGTWVSTASTLRPGLSVLGKPNDPSPVSTPTGLTDNVSPAVAPVTTTIPPTNLNRTLVLCFDGTGDQFDSDNSNIVELFSMLKKDDPDKQLVYYQAGIGTYTTPQVATPFASSISKSMDMAIAWNLDAHIMSGYEFLMQNYRTNDKICIFGFSRGAYTARCLAGMIHKVGLLPTCNHQQIPFAYKMYTKADDDGWKMSNAFKKTFSIDVDIEFLGVWDTVNSVGLIPRRLPFTTSNTVVKTFRHALALDERRSKFKANHWNRPTASELDLSMSDRQTKARAKKAEQHEHDHSHDVRGKPVKKASLKQLEVRYAKERAKETDIEEVWFAGCHCDVGGGSVDNGIKPCLARIPLRWMIRECFKAKSGILLEMDGLKRIGLDPARLYPDVLPRPPALPLNTYAAETCLLQQIPKNVPKDNCDDDDADDLLYGTELTETEEEADLKDSLAPVYDQLKLAWNWWILELLPTKVRYQEEKETDDSTDWEWTTKVHFNMGEGRHIPRQHSEGVKIHRSVKTRLEAAHLDGSKYKPAVTNLALDCVTWVD